MQRSINVENAMDAPDARKAEFFYSIIEIAARLVRLIAKSQDVGLAVEDLLFGIAVISGKLSLVPVGFDGARRDVQDAGGLIRGYELVGHMGHDDDDNRLLR
jgi:hypothetical protein